MTTNQKLGALAGAVVLTAGITAAVLLSGGVTNVPAGADLQAYINAASTGDTLQLANAVYTGNFTENKGLTIIGPAVLKGAIHATPTLVIPPVTPPVVLKNLEITTADTGQIYAIVEYGGQGTAQDTIEEQPQGLTMDGVWVHGQTTQEVQRCIAANGRNFKFINGKATDCHGRGYDSQAIAVWNGSGPFVIADSRLEGAGENILFGGADPSIPNLIPSDIEIRRNHIIKPLSWKVGDPTYTGIHWTIKNLLELKNARNVVIDGNILENCWGDAQIGYAVLFTVRNQDGTTPWAIIENVQFTNNTIKNSEQGIQTLGKDSPNVSQQSNGLRIANNLFTDIKHWGVVVSSYANLTIEHNTHFQGHNVLVLTGASTTQFTYRNNLTFRNDYGVKGDGLEEGNASLQVFTPQAVFQGNVLVNALARIYPTGNYYPTTMAEVQLGADYRLASTSPYKGKATDGKDPGVDMDALLAAQAGSIQPTPSVTATPTQTPTPAPLPSPTPTLAPTATPTPQPSPTQQPCPMTAWPSSVAGQNQKMEQQRALGCYPVRRPPSGQGMEYARP